MPVLARADALRRTLAVSPRARAGAVWPTPPASPLADLEDAHVAVAAVPEPVRAGWAVLRTHLPDMLPGPPHEADGWPGREEPAR